MGYRLKTDAGILSIVVLLIICIATMLILIALPHISNYKPRTSQYLDMEFENAASDLATLHLIDFDGHAVMAYDAEHKKFVDVGNMQPNGLRRLSIKAYGLEREHRGKFLVFFFHGDELSFDFSWLSKDELLEYLAKENE